MVNQFDECYWCIVVNVEVIFQNMKVVVWMFGVMWVDFGEQFDYDVVVVQMVKSQMFVSQCWCFVEGDYWFNNMV